MKKKQKMDEGYNNRVYRQVQISRNRDPVWNSGDYSDTTWTSPNLSNHNMGRCLSPVGIPYQTEENVTGLSSPKAKTPEQNNHDNGNRQEGSPNNDKHHVFASKKDDHEKITKNSKGKTERKKKAIPVKNDRASLHVWGVSPQWKTKDADKKDDIRQQQADSKLESRKYTSIAVVSFECCPNRKRIQEFETPLGELCRVGSVVGTSGTLGTTWSKEQPTTPCHLVLPDSFLTRRTGNQTPMSEGNGLHESSHAHNSSIMAVEKIKNEYDRHRIATSVGLDILSKESYHTEYMESIKEFGFNHIIIVGERDYGMLFLDCYGRMFEWDHINLLLWPLGNYLENKPRVAWGVEFDGTITEFEVDEN
ncbi:hypothetical protein C1645_856067 [Glomus cerebriforme]|uniref:Uncharacterized protein n=1 Tax=Glomus cerebriforme TaxID=658196 RepID=A0A397SK41_9GLOM|nr:hypothetical protein C1645_856067 [Glomus cerebriforme]